MNGNDDHVYCYGKVLEFYRASFSYQEPGHWSLAWQQLLFSMQYDSSYSPTVFPLRGLSNTLIYNQILSCVPTSHLAVSLLQQLRNEKLRPTEMTFGACLNACVKNGQWRMALAIQDILCDDWFLTHLFGNELLYVLFFFKFEFSSTKSFTSDMLGEYPKGYLSRA